MGLQMSAVGRIGTSRTEEKKLLEGDFLSLLSLVAKAKKRMEKIRA